VIGLIFEKRAERFQTRGHVAYHGSRLACPFFVPISRAARQPAFRVPLRAFWLGECALGPPVAEDLQLDGCNFGYANGLCARISGEREADAVRFSERPGGPIFILEREGAPLRWGPAASIPPSSPLAAQYAAWNST
jgi:hypothetical protein